ncbi:MAG: ABC transporter permease [Tropicimonas sp.]|uniref:ABC transporter permease n=1 Tax=Tropicimonas sp. TaxID=2067044 RepID=UPI003A85A1A2
MTERGLPITFRRRIFALGGAGLALGAAILFAFAMLALVAPWLDLPAPEAMDLSARLAPPSRAHPLGTDQLGRDMLARLIGGIPVSLGSAVSAVGLIAVIALPWGLVAGLAGGRVDMVMMRLADIFLAFPSLVLALAVIGFMGASLEASVIGVAAAWWPALARLVRSLVLSAAERDFVRAARLCGASPLRIVGRHILPQVLPPLAVILSLEVASVLLALSSLSFLGIGAQAPTPEWGAMLNAARPFFAQAPALLLAPGLAVVLAVLAFNLIGEGLREMLDERKPYQW